MANFYLICGISGGGKTTLSKKIHKLNPSLNVFDVDEYYAKINGDECIRDNFFKVWINLYEDLHDSEIKGEDVLLTTNALTASNSVMIPVQCEFFALEGIMQLLNTIQLARQKVNPTLEIEGVVLTMLDSRTILGLDVVENIRSFFKEKVYDTIVPRLIILAEAPSHGKPISYYNSKSKGSAAYINLAKEVIERNAREEKGTR
jgi:hypothetical protein